MTTPPPLLARKLVRYIVGCGVSVAIGLAPYLGRLKVPGFTPLLSLMPENIQGIAIPLSAALMGVVAVVVQWYGNERVSRKWLRKAFKRALVLALLSFVVLIVVHTLVVVRGEYEGGRESKTYLIGFLGPDNPDPCTAQDSDSQCLGKVGYKIANIESHWGNRQIQIAKLALILSYLLVTSSFGLLVGLLLLEGEGQSGPRSSQQRIRPR